MVQLGLKIWGWVLKGGTVLLTVLTFIGGLLFFNKIKYAINRSKEAKLRTQDQQENASENSTADTDAKKAEDGIEKFIKENQ